MLCGAVAFDKITFGWQKFIIYNLLFPLGMLDLPFSKVDDVSLMWAFFGHSYPFTVTIGLLQMLGSFLLLFSKTRLLGVFMLLPILVTILNIDTFLSSRHGCNSSCPHVNYSIALSGFSRF
jgi:hypothetical protein